MGIELYYDKIYKKVEEELFNNGNFFSETFESLRENNPHLAGFMSKVVTTTEKNPDIQKRTLWMSLIALKILGATDKNNSTFVAISQGTIEQTEIALTDDSKLKMEEIETYISSLNVAYNHNERNSEKILFQDIWSAVEKSCKVVLSKNQKFQKSKTIFRQAGKEFKKAGF